MVAELRCRHPPGRVSIASLLAATAIRGDTLNGALCTLQPQSVECLHRGAKGLLLVPIPPDSHAWHQNTEAFHIANCGRAANFQKGLGNCWWLRGDCGRALQVGLKAPGGMMVGAMGNALQQGNGGCGGHCTAVGEW